MIISSRKALVCPPSIVRESAFMDPNALNRLLYSCAFAATDEKEHTHKGSIQYTGLDVTLLAHAGPYKLISAVLGEQFWYNRIRRYRVNFVGDRDGEGSRENRGICWWPDPPTGGGESYHGLWRADQPHGHGIFRWFDGDKYLGQWNDGQVTDFCPMFSV